MNGGTRTFDISNGSASTDLLISTEIANGALTKTGAGTLTLTGSNTFTGVTTVNAGTLEAGAAGALGATASVAVNNGGTLLLSGSGNRVNDSAPVTLTDGTFNTGGLSETVGTLTLSATSTLAIIDMGAGISLLTFASAGGTPWNGTRSI